MSGVLVHGVVRCPGCGGLDLETVSDGDATNFLCLTCSSCWHVELGWMQRVDPRGCISCPHSAECLERIRSADQETGVGPGSFTGRRRGGREGAGQADGPRSRPSSGV